MPPITVYESDHESEAGSSNAARTPSSSSKPSPQLNSVPLPSMADLFPKGAEQPWKNAKRGFKFKKNPSSVSSANGADDTGEAKEPKAKAEE